MKPFNLDAAKAGDAVITRDGCKAVYMLTLMAGYPVFHVTRKCGTEDMVYSFRADGRRYADGSDSDFDLFMAPVQRTVWANLYHQGTQVAYIYPTEEDADASAGAQRDKRKNGGKAIPITFEE